MYNIYTSIYIHTYVHMYTYNYSYVLAYMYASICVCTCVRFFLCCLVHSPKHRTVLLQAHRISEDMHFDPSVCFRYASVCNNDCIFWRKKLKMQKTCPHRHIVFLLWSERQIAPYPATAQQVTAE